MKLAYKTKKKYAWQNRRLENLKGERWKDIPGLEGYFMISSLGRVKRLEYELEFSDGRIYTKESMIMKPTLSSSPNHFKKDRIFFLHVTLTLAKTIYNYSVGRLVYYCFVAPFDLTDNELLVVCGDGDGRNIQISNLVMMNYSGRQLKMIRLGQWSAKYPLQYSTTRMRSPPI